MKRGILFCSVLEIKSPLYPFQGNDSYEISNSLIVTATTHQPFTPEPLILYIGFAYPI